MARLHLVTQAYGREEILVQALYAAWSGLAWAGELPLDVHVYTDSPAAFAPLAGRVDLRVLSAEEIRAWRGPHDFVHRLKAAMLRDLAARFPDGKLLYVDADVLFTGPLAALFERIGPGRAVMHEREYPVATHPSSQMRKFRARMRPLTFRGRPVDLSCHMWNAGVVGLDPAHFGLLDEWLEFVDEIYPRYPRFLIEQFAISRLLEREGEVAPSDDLVLHYWFQKDDYVAVIRRELEVLRALPEGEQLAHLREEVPRLPRRRQRLTLAQRVRRILSRAR